VTVLHAWDCAGEYAVRAGAKDLKDLMSDWSGPHILTVRDSLK
jgi:hypothetical protein